MTTRAPTCACRFRTCHQDTYTYTLPARHSSLGHTLHPCGHWIHPVCWAAHFEHHREYPALQCGCKIPSMAVWEYGLFGVMILLLMLLAGEMVMMVTGR